ncbi:hypothetical protein ELH43_08610 [Rhizobium ruizarguesonis]|uniref:hypothetical protein n=1 Tax=Rhizobium ruizarguesonis TaxID=2081791 RepID=UPI0010323659|nr:hypothetical protein [Rhizobium ruizarguesonis]TBB75444.1 hypothetical protein ELH43_08610 [Rhizobium ruizarguesonis]
MEEIDLGIEEDTPDRETISFKHFLEKTHAGIEKVVGDVWEPATENSIRKRKILYPSIRLHCQTCDGMRSYRVVFNPASGWSQTTMNTHAHYRCGDCLEDKKQYALHVELEDDGSGKIFKYGEFPTMGTPVPKRVLKLLGDADGKLFLKGRQCENLGYGIGAFAYYRRVVENHRNDLFDEIIKVCETVGASGDLIEELKEAKKEISFMKSMEKIKSGVPQGLLIDGHNPLNALHKALSISLHNEADEDCLEYAASVRLVLSDLVERIASLRQDNKQLSQAVQRLLSKKKG